MSAGAVPESVPFVGPVTMLISELRGVAGNEAVKQLIDSALDAKNEAGIRTPIDLLRAIAGELPDLGSRERAEMIAREDGSWLVDGHLGIEEVQQRLGRRDMGSRNGEYHTLAGFVLARLGRIPKAGDVLSWRDLRVEVLDMDGLRIDKVLLVPISRERPA